ncbi:outer membrane protein assembly factor BamE [Paraglaciecola aquimarina]|uniref:Outer membrane protein assembly factor BamE n=1 Tax=Paraglaciecola aquimarina TaxID=1235557 RepID=A0ABU3SSU7_9ALTE|nr:outer membrane protein assembly factor BamE [Paraglaciecola aquimarina]MDU0353047.1 outer membrane protein assembly factor BamE [Paraglaciecola aquimarina]
MMLTTKARKLLTVMAAISAVTMGCSSTSSSGDANNYGIQEGATMVTLVNLHPDHKRKVLYAVNYQLAGSIIPMCTEVKIEDVGNKEIEFNYNGVTYTYLWDKHTRNAGESLLKNVSNFIGPACDKNKVASLSALDQAGIKSGKPSVGMTKDGVLFAMGRPPIHANPSLEGATWMYWLNKFKKQAIEFDANGKVTEIRL